MNKRVIVVIIAILLVSALLTGCGSKNAIVGEWQGTLNSVTFFKDGIMNMSILGMGVQGTYEFVDSDTIRVSYQGTTSDFNVKVSGDNLYLENGGVSTTYTRVK